MANKSRKQFRVKSRNRKRFLLVWVFGKPAKLQAHNKTHSDAPLPCNTVYVKYAAREIKLRQGNYKVVLILIMLIFRYTIFEGKGRKGNFSFSV